MRTAHDKAAVALHHWLSDRFAGYGSVSATPDGLCVITSLGSLKAAPVTWHGYPVAYTFNAPIAANLMAFASHVERDEWLKNHADYFTVVRHIGRGKYDRHEFLSLPDAELKAQELANSTHRPYMIYAVAGVHDAYVATKKPAKEGA